MSGKLILWVSLSRSQEGQGEKRVMSRGGVILPLVLPYWKGWAAQAYAGILYQLSATKTSCQRTITCGCTSLAPDAHPLLGEVGTGDI